MTRNRCLLFLRQSAFRDTSAPAMIVLFLALFVFYLLSHQRRITDVQMQTAGTKIIKIRADLVRIIIIAETIQRICMRMVYVLIMEQRLLQAAMHLQRRRAVEQTQATLEILGMHRCKQCRQV